METYHDFKIPTAGRCERHIPSYTLFKTRTTYECVDRRVENCIK